MANHIAHMEIMGADYARSQKFYGDLFGWSLGPAQAEMGGYAMSDAKSSGLSVGIGTEGPSGRSRTTFYVDVPDLQAALDKAVQLGGKVVSPPMEIPGTGVSIAQFSDPDGNLVGLSKGMG
ncbi:MAG: VOC family protein [Chloroflexi bacterium]|nr:VOC family protein [Chloroflexota bacterium]